ncbi:unnamed protein product [Calypogeia fissa]
MMAPKCGVCEDSESKYKCPVCRTPYCSLPCYNPHKAGSDDIWRMLRDDELRKLIQKVDSSITPEKDLDQAMDRPALREFTDKIWAMINLDEHSHLTQS